MDFYSSSPLLNKKIHPCLNQAHLKHLDKANAIKGVLSSEC